VLIALLSGGQAPAKTFVLVAAEQLAPAADDWAAYRASTGWTVTPLLVPRGSTNDEVRARLRAIIGERPAEDVVVMLLGDADDMLPTWHHPQPDVTMRGGHGDTFATDLPYQDLDHDGMPDVRLGRIPSRTNDEARDVLSKIRHYESTPAHGESRRRVTFVAGEGHYGAIDGVLEQMFARMVDLLVPPAFEISMTYMKPSSAFCPPIDDATPTVLRRLGEGAYLFMFIGHGTADSFDRLYCGFQPHPTLSRHDLNRLERTGMPPVALLSCCSAGWFDREEGTRSLAETMLLEPNGPVAVIAGSRITHPYANALRVKDTTRAMLGMQVRTVGELDLRVDRSIVVQDAEDQQIDLFVGPMSRMQRWPSTLPELRVMHVALYNLLGDPATTISPPTGRIDVLDPGTSLIRGRCTGVTDGTVTITLETDRIDDAIMPVNNDACGLEPADVRARYEAANDRVVSRHRVPLSGGVFDLELDESASASASWIRIFASGTDDAGNATEAFTAVRIQAKKRSGRVDGSPSGR